MSNNNNYNMNYPNYSSDLNRNNDDDIVHNYNDSINNHANYVEAANNIFSITRNDMHFQSSFIKSNCLFRRIYLLLSQKLQNLLVLLLNVIL